MKRISLFLCLILLLATAHAEDVYSFFDDTGKEIVLSRKPLNTAVLFSSFAEMWLDSGGTLSVTVGETIKRGFAQENTIVVDNGAGKAFDIEMLVMSGADFVIGSADVPFHQKARKQMEKAGIPFALFRVESLEDYLHVFEIMTTINQSPEAYEMYGEKVYLEANDIIEKAKEYAKISPKDILFIRSGSGYSSAKAKTSEMHFAACMLDALGARNIADDVPVIIDGLSFEEIYSKDPDAIFISLMGDETMARKYMESVLDTPQWQSLSAVKNGRCFFLSKELFQYKPNAKWAEAYREMARMLYPEWTEECKGS